MAEIATDGKGVPQDASNFDQTTYESGHKNRTKSFYRVFFSWRNLIGFLWLAPAITLLVLNFNGQIVGAGVGCLGSNCRIDPYSTNQVEQAQVLDKRNHDILGALQYVAKAIEVWFMYVAGSLVYNLALRLARKDGLPLDLLTVYAEFLDLLYLTELIERLRDVAKEQKQIKTSPSPPEAQPNHLLLYIFMVFVAALCIVANFMGAATAVLILPTLEWVDINVQNDIAFGVLASSGPPRDTTFSPTCTEAELQAGNYSCTSKLYQTSLDQMAAAVISTDRQATYRMSTLLPPVSQEGYLTFSVNVSESSSIIWGPSRQLLREFSTDLVNFYNATTSDEPFLPQYSDSILFNHSIDATLQRQGPAIGLVSGCTLASVWNSTISPGREVRCYPGAQDTKCIRLGNGWGGDSQSSSVAFTIQDAVLGENLSVSVYTTNKAAYLSHPECYNGAGSCDWDAIFSAAPPQDRLNVSGYQMTFEYTSQEADSPIWCSAAAFLGFASYIVDPSPLSNIINMVQIDLITDDPNGNSDTAAAALNINPDWILAAWSVNSGGVVNGYRDAAILAITTSISYFENGDESALDFTSIHRYSVIQALSFLPYNTTQPSDSTPSSYYLGASATVQLWKFGLDSRTARLGAAIVIIGCLCVGARTALYLEATKAPSDLINVALHHDIPTPGAQARPPLQHRDSSMMNVKYNRAEGTFSFHVKE
jgi:hypothetical protein